jgi:hypothetical protein
VHACNFAPVIVGFPLKRFSSVVDLSKDNMLIMLLCIDTKNLFILESTTFGARGAATFFCLSFCEI